MDWVGDIVSLTLHYINICSRVYFKVNFTTINKDIYFPWQFIAILFFDIYCSEEYFLQVFPYVFTVISVVKSMLNFGVFNVMDLLSACSPYTSSIFGFVLGKILLHVIFILRNYICRIVCFCFSDSSDCLFGICNSVAACLSVVLQRLFSWNHSCPVVGSFLCDGICLRLGIMSASPSAVAQTVVCHVILVKVDLWWNHL